MKKLYLPFPGKITRKRRRHWRRQILKNNPDLNPDYLDAKYEMKLIYNDGTFGKSIARFSLAANRMEYERCQMMRIG